MGQVAAAAAAESAARRRRIGGDNGDLIAWIVDSHVLLEFGRIALSYGQLEECRRKRPRQRSGGGGASGSVVGAHADAIAR